VRTAHQALKNNFKKDKILSRYFLG